MSLVAEIELDPDQAAAADRVAEWLENPLRGTREPGVFRLFGYAGSGKALAFDQEVQTPNGPRSVSALSVGDEVFGADGRPTLVIGVYPQGVKKSYRLSTRDGASVECDLEHLWSVWTAKLRSTRKPLVTLALREMLSKGVMFPSGLFRYYVPLCAPLEYPARAYLLDPYVLGALIGDGTGLGRVPTLCLPEAKEPVLDEVRRRLPAWCRVTVTRQSGCNYHRLTDPRRKRGNEIRDELVRLGLNVNSPERFVPGEYLIGSIRQRWDLLRGLMDTDGSCRANRTSFSTMSPRLASDVQRLVQSLGGTGIIRSQDRGPKGLEFSVNVKTFECPFLAPTKSKHWRPSRKNPPSRAVVSIASSRSCEHTCIKVSAPDGLFLTKDHLVTHNTTIARQIAARAGGRVRFAAFTGKAALVMRQKGCAGASTIHSLIYVPKTQCARRLRELAEQLRTETDADRRRELEALHSAEKDNLARPSFSLNEGSDLRDASLLILDECSMIGQAAGADLLSFGVPILALGDPAQLPPVRDRGYFTDPRQEPDVLLRAVHRQAGGSPVLELCTQARERATLPYGPRGDSAVVRRRDLSIAQAAEFDQIIVGRNSTRAQINSLVRAHLGHATPLPVPGDRVVCRRNDHDVGLLNGGQWTVVSSQQTDEDTVELTVLDEERGGVQLTVDAHVGLLVGRDVPFYELRRAQCFEYAYAVTCHTAQGSQWRSVCVVDESQVFGQDAWRWLYTSISRASERVTVVR